MKTTWANADVFLGVNRVLNSSLGGEQKVRHPVGKKKTSIIKKSPALNISNKSATNLEQDVHIHIFRLIKTFSQKLAISG